jgi:hypothetical protein
MALTFPADTSQPYVDTTSGLKYVYNSAVGAWESAIQPPVIITDQAPSIELDGFLWYDTVNAAVYIRFGDNWVLLTNPGGGGGGGGGGGTTGVTISENPPEPAANGQLWWDNNLGRLFIYYIDPSTDQQWLEASPNIDGINGGGAFSGPNAPTGATEGDLWYNTTNGELSVFYDGTWRPVQSQIEGVVLLDATEPIFLSGDDANPIVNIRDASAATKGAVRMATQAEVNNPTLSTVALSPAALENSLQSDPSVYIADASTTSKGIVELATGAEAIAGSSATKVVTPDAPSDALSSVGTLVPTGSVIAVANGTNIPTGYLLCNGSAVSRTTYSDLFSVIDVLYGNGNGSTTFNVPNMSGAISGLQYGAYCIKT